MMYVKRIEEETIAISPELESEFFLGDLDFDFHAARGDRVTRSVRFVMWRGEEDARS